jgi:1-acyl-sn-glycerol-3-phosphate acyltransferase
VAWVECHLGGISYRVIGRENIPKGACIIAAKHQSALETFKIHLIVDDPAIVLKRELLNIPIIGWYMSRSGSIPIDRSGRTKALSGMTVAARKAAADGRPIVIFPEGTRAAVGETRPYKSGVAAMYQDLNVPLVPMALNSGLLWPKDSFFKKRGLVTVEFLPPIPPACRAKR